MNDSKRINYIDFLKVIGLSGIIIAHVDSPNLLMMIRSFDVPLMVILSALLAKKSINKYSNNVKDIFLYLISRIKRLVIPTWIFLTFYFMLRFMITHNFNEFRYYVDSYLLTRYGIGYVWVILIYLYCAILIPIFKKIGKYSFKKFIIIVVIYVIYEILFYFKIGTDNKIIESTFYYLIPYGLLTYIGYNYDEVSKKEKCSLLLLNVLLFLLLMSYYYVVEGSFQLVSIAKYPPRLYYLSYGILCSLLLMIICSKNNINIYKNKIILFISSHSMWIYLWHILVLDIYAKFNLPRLWYIKFIIVYIVSIIIVFTINKVLDCIEKKRKFDIIKYLRG